MTSHKPLSTGRGKLLKILGFTFNVALVIGGTIGVGILRNPGEVAAQLNSVWLILLAWSLGGIYTLLRANYIAELATMLPKAGGYYVYAHRAYGNYGGFVVGLSDWLNNTLGLAYIAIVFGEYAGELFFPNLPGGAVLFSITILLLLTGLNWIGLRAGSRTQKITSLLKAIAFITFVAACFVFAPIKIVESTSKPAAVDPSGYALFIAFILAFQRVLATYSGANTAIYFTEENINPSKNIPRSLFGGISLIIIIYLLVNLALLYTLPLTKIANSKFAVAEAMRQVFGEQSGKIVSLIALISIIGIINASLMYVPRIMFALSRDGLFVAKACRVNKGGTPDFALLMTALPAIVLTVVGTFDTLLSVSSFFSLTNQILLIGALFILRKREPDLQRPYKTWGYPVAPFVILTAAVLLFFGYILGNPRNSMYAIGALLASYPVYRLTRRLSPTQINDERRST